MAVIILLFWLFSSVLLLNTCISSENTTVEIESGVRIRGFQMTTLNNRKILAFRGIPYAEPPVGKLRFKPPVRKEWKEKTFDARKEGNRCIQMTFPLHTKFIETEDCLILNVYTPNIKEPKKVMVFIHGGGFVWGSSNQYGPRRLLDRDVVLVTINFRLGVFGFLSTLNKASPGNYALLDQHEALKWVNRNIAAFGGDPNKVTLFGQSAGSGAVMNHLISPLSSGLFHRAICQSGTVITNYAEQKNPMKWTKLLAKTVNCDRSNSKELMTCLRKISTKKLVNAAYLISNFGNLNVFTVVADGIFHSQLPSKLLRDGFIANRVPLLMGVTKDEGLLHVPAIYIKLFKFSKKVLRNVVAEILNLKEQQITNDVIQLIKKQYFKPKDLKNEQKLIETFGKLISDGAYFTQHYEAVQLLLAANIKPFLYSHDYVTNHSVLKILGLKDTKGVAHTDDLFFLFDMPDIFPEDYQTPNDKTENNFLDIWTNFAENGYPAEKTASGIIKWEAAISDRINVHHMDKKTKIINYNPKNDWQSDFWLRKVPSLLINSTKCKEKK